MKKKIRHIWRRIGGQKIMQSVVLPDFSPCPRRKNSSELPDSRTFGLLFNRKPTGCPSARDIVVEPRNHTVIRICKTCSKTAENTSLNRVRGKVEKHNM
ncbi:MAG: hypothetical protein D4R65_01190 [Verrucomicrobiaceae bacterium]|nr:MAG: hypothetical protein D4R65_01190 [Verrucomicrobiaceae bacterium]